MPAYEISGPEPLRSPRSQAASAGEVIGNIFRIALALIAVVVILRVGLGFLRMMAQPLPEPPPPGELRKVRILYRCSICGTEVRMTAANNEVPDPPRHCLEDMDLVAPIE